VPYGSRICSATPHSRIRIIHRFALLTAQWHTKVIDPRPEPLAVFLVMLNVRGPGWDHQLHGAEGVGNDCLVRIGQGAVCTTTDEMGVTWMMVPLTGGNEQNPSKNEECTIAGPAWQFSLLAILYESDFDSVSFDDLVPSNASQAITLDSVDGMVGTAKVLANKDALTAGKYKVTVQLTGIWTGSQKDPNCSTCPNCGNCNSNATTDVVLFVDECCKITSITADKDPVAVGSPVTFTATGPENACLEKIKWSNGGNPSTATGPTFTTTFTETGEKTVQAKCPTGEPETKKVTVVGVKEIVIDPASLCDCSPGYYLTGNSIVFIAKPQPDVPNFPETPVWELVSQPDPPPGNPPSPPAPSLTPDGPKATLMPTRAGTYKITAKEGTSEKDIAIQVLQKPRVGLWGDVRATESNIGDSLRDKLSILAAIPAGQATLPFQLTVNYSVAMETASNADFDYSDQMILNLGHVQINANERISNTLTIYPISEDPNPDTNNPETFVLNLSAGDCYSTSVYRQDYIELGTNGRILLNNPRYYIYECQTLFVRGEDDLGIDEDNPGIDGSDVSQGMIANCYMMATLASVAESCPSVIENHLQDIEGVRGGYQVLLYYAPEGSSVPTWNYVFVFDEELSQGPNMAQPSKDVNDNGCVEIWPVIYERAMQKALYQLSAFGGATTEAIHLMLTGTPVSSTIDATSMTSDDLLAAIQTHFVYADKNIILETISNPGYNPNWAPDPNLSPEQNTQAEAANEQARIIQEAFKEANELLKNSVPQQPELAMNHAYYVQGYTASTVVLDNPWGEGVPANGSVPPDRDADVTIPKEILDAITGRLVIFPGCN